MNYCSKESPLEATIYFLLNQVFFDFDEGGWTNYHGSKPYLTLENYIYVCWFQLLKRKLLLWAIKKEKEYPERQTFTREKSLPTICEKLLLHRTLSHVGTSIPRVLRLRASQIIFNSSSKQDVPSSTSFFPLHPPAIYTNHWRFYIVTMDK